MLNKSEMMTLSKMADGESTDNVRGNATFRDGKNPEYVHQDVPLTFFLDRMYSFSLNGNPTRITQGPNRVEISFSHGLVCSFDRLAKKNTSIYSSMDRNESVDVISYGMQKINNLMNGLDYQGNPSDCDKSKNREVCGADAMILAGNLLKLFKIC